MKLRSITALIIATATAFSLFACNADPSGGSADESAQASAVSDTSETASVPEESKEELEKKDLGGKVITFVVADSSYTNYESFEIGVDENSSDLINTAVAARNTRIEDEYNCTINVVKDKSIAALEYQYVTTGVTDYDVYMPMLNESVAYVGDCIFTDLKDTCIQLENSYWDQSMIESVSFKGKTFFATGDISVLDNDCTMVMFFNKDMVSSRSLEDPYQLVRDHKWTLDKVYEMCRDVTTDNGDGTWNNEDTYGLHVAFNAPHSFFFGCGGTLAEKTSDGFKITANSEKNIQILDKVFDIAYSDRVVTNKTAGCTDWTNIVEMFSAGRIMMTTLALIDMNYFKNDNINFGILPYPLYDETQENYTCLVSTALVPVVTIPSNCKDVDAAATVIEAMAFYSRHNADSLTSAYYEKTLKLRLLKDNDSEEMLDIIFKNRVYDLGFIFNWGGLGMLIENMNSRSNDNFVSEFEAISDKVNSEMDKTVDAFNNI